jgi:UDP-glucose 4-epimerase
MTTLVTGGAGYIGSHIVRQLSEASQDLIVLDNLSTGFRESLLHNEKFILGDVRDREFLDRIFSENKIDSVIHMAASIAVGESVQFPTKYYDNNVGGMISVLAACEKYKVKKFVFSSTAAVYGAPDRGGYASEEDPRRPDSPYGASKAMAERLLRDSAKISGMSYAILRYFNVAGADPEGRIGQKGRDATHLIKICCEAASGKRKFVEIYGEDYPTLDGTCVRDYIHVEDLASAHLLVLEKLEDKGSALVLNVGYGKGLSVKAVIDATWRVTGKTFKVRIAKRRMGDPETIVARADKIKALGWRPKFNSIEKIITDAYNFEKKL